MVKRMRKGEKERQRRKFRKGRNRKGDYENERQKSSRNGWNHNEVW